MIPILILAAFVAPVVGVMVGWSLVTGRWNKWMKDQRPVRAIREWAAHETNMAQFQQVFKAITPTRRDRRQISNLAHHLLVHHIELGATITDIEATVGLRDSREGVSFALPGP